MNHDEQVDVTDAVLIIDEILLKNPANFDASLADVNHDNTDAFVNVDRAMFVTVGGERHELLINGTTAIASSMLNSQCLMLNNVYDLQGRRVSSAVANWLSPSDRRAKPSSLFTLHSSLKKGLYIANGKKIVK